MRGNTGAALRKGPGVRCAVVLCSEAEDHKRTPYAKRIDQLGTKTMFGGHMTELGAKLEDMRYWGRLHDVIANRVSILNQIHNCRYSRNYANPVQHRHRGGTYAVEIYGQDVCEYAMYDLDSTQRALDVLDMLTDLYWNGTTGGWLVARPESNDHWEKLLAV